MVFGLGGGIKIYVNVDPASDTNKVVQLDHSPSWKIRKNPFHHAVNRHKLSSETSFKTTTTMTSGTFGESQNNLAIPNTSNTSYAYDSSQDINGIITLVIPNGKRYDHLGIKVQFVGRISTLAMQQIENRSHYDFISLSKELAPPGSIYTSQVQFPFEFKNMEKPYETYHGRNCLVAYFVRVFVERKFLPPVISEKEIMVQSLVEAPAINEPIKMEVGIEDCLHIEFEYEKRYYHLKDVIIGKIHFLLVKIKIKYMELAVIRRETSGDVPSGSTVISGPRRPDAVGGKTNSGDDKNVFTETQTLVKHEIMDGAPVKGEMVPVRLHLAGIPADLTPTFESTQNNRFSVKYLLNLVLVDEEDRRYFKQQEIILWRKELGS